MAQEESITEDTLIPNVHSVSLSLSLSLSLKEETK